MHQYLSSWILWIFYIIFNVGMLGIFTRNPRRESSVETQGQSASRSLIPERFRER